jgi:hypothetical protein
MSNKGISLFISGFKRGGKIIIISELYNSKNAFYKHKNRSGSGF